MLKRLGDRGTKVSGKKDQGVEDTYNNVRTNYRGAYQRCKPRSRVTGLFRLRESIQNGKTEEKDGK